MNRPKVYVRSRLGPETRHWWPLTEISIGYRSYVSGMKSVKQLNDYYPDYEFTDDPMRIMAIEAEREKRSKR